MEQQLPIYIHKYQDKFASNKWSIYGVSRTFKTIIVVPAIAEYENIKSLLSSLNANEPEYFSSTLILFVVNHIVNSNEDIKKENLETIKCLKAIIDQDKNDLPMKNIIEKSQLQIGYIDAASADFELNEKDGGVGLARKIGMDAALKIFNYDLPYKNILVCLDADCIVSENYISTIRNFFNKNDFSAAYVNFEHMKPKEEENYKAIINYEIFLRYYVLGLHFANSPYAYHSIGSTMVCDTESYVNIQGMNKRKAAEDFYFMEKLSKIVEIKKIDGTKVYPSSRGSWRVPFGTGKRVSRFLEKVQNEYLLYSPSSYEVLKKWLAIFHSENILTGQEYLKEAKNIDDSLSKFLISSKFEIDWENILKNTKSANQINKQKKIWFDGFKTLKLIHYLRDTTYPMINMFDALEQIFQLMKIEIDYKNNKNTIPPLDIQSKFLKTLRDIA